MKSLRHHSPLLWGIIATAALLGHSRGSGSPAAVDEHRVPESAPLAESTSLPLQVLTSLWLGAHSASAAEPPAPQPDRLPALNQGAIVTALRAGLLPRMADCLKQEPGTLSDADLHWHIVLESFEREGVTYLDVEAVFPDHIPIAPEALDRVSVCLQGEVSLLQFAPGADPLHMELPFVTRRTD